MRNGPIAPVATLTVPAPPCGPVPATRDFGGSFGVARVDREPRLPVALEVEAADRVPVPLGEPDVAVGADRDPERLPVAREPAAVLRHDTARVIRPICPCSVNQRLPSGPAAIPPGKLFGPIPCRYSVVRPAGDLADDVVVPDVVVSREPHVPVLGPAARPVTRSSTSRPSPYSVMTPAGVTFAIFATRGLAFLRRTTRRRPPGGDRAPGEGVDALAERVMLPDGAVFQTAFSSPVNQRLPSLPAVIAREAVRGRDAILGDAAGRRHPPDTATAVGEPDISVLDRWRSPAANRTSAEAGSGRLRV